MSVKEIGYKFFNHQLYYTSPDGKAECTPIPINSRAAVVHNMSLLINDMHKNYNDINEKDKLKYCLLNKPNQTNSDVFAYQNPQVIKDLNLESHINRDDMWSRFFIQALDIMIEPLKWSYTKKITIDEWF
jgi:hypothetical protein